MNFGIALYNVLSYIVTGGLMRFATFGLLSAAFYFMSGSLVDLLSDFIINDQYLKDINIYQYLDSDLADFFKYLLWLGAVDWGFPLIISSYLMRFLIRRLPIIG